MWANTRVPGGVSGVFLKSKRPPICSCAESLGLILDHRTRLRAILACGMVLFHRCMGNLLSVEHQPAIRWFLAVQVANWVESPLLPPTRFTSYGDMVSIRSQRNLVPHDFNAYEKHGFHRVTVIDAVNTGVCR